MLKLLRSKRIFSIIIPVYNGEKTIERTLASLVSNKEYIKEVVIIDDCSTDNTSNIIRRFENCGFFDIKYRRNENRIGPGPSRGIGINNASGKWITFVDADDCLTASSLRYVYDNVVDRDELVLLHTQSIYYESGTFNSDNVDFSDTSCGGNFYLRKYLVDNSLFPSDELFMCEDEYFNEKVISYIYYIDGLEESIDHYCYPVYEVHHDIDDGLSFALDNWADYCCKYHLLYKQLLVDDYISINHMYYPLLLDYMNNFIFCYFLLQGLEKDDDIDFNKDDYIKYYSDAILYFEKTFNLDRDFLIQHFYGDEDNVGLLFACSISSVGFAFDSEYNFKDFVNSL